MGFARRVMHPMGSASMIAESGLGVRALRSSTELDGSGSPSKLDLL